MRHSTTCPGPSAPAYCLALAACLAALLGGCNDGAAPGAAAPTASAAASAPALPPAPPSSEAIARGFQDVAATPVCGAIKGGLQVTAERSKMGFKWAPVREPAAATRYAARVSRTDGANAPPVVIADKLVEAGEPLAVEVNEHAQGAQYLVRIVALKDDTPICSINGGAS